MDHEKRELLIRSCTKAYFCFQYSCFIRIPFLVRKNPRFYMLVINGVDNIRFMTEHLRYIWHIAFCDTRSALIPPCLTRRACLPTGHPLKNPSSPPIRVPDKPSTLLYSPIRGDLLTHNIKIHNTTGPSWYFIKYLPVKSFKIENLIIKTHRSFPEAVTNKPAVRRLLQFRL